MNNYEALLDEANDTGLKVKELPLRSSDGRIKGNKIGIRKDIETVSYTHLLVFPSNIASLASRPKT